MLSQPNIETIFQQFATVRLYEDRVPEGTKQMPDAEEAQDFASQKLGNYARPYYVVLTVQGKTLTKIAEYDKGLIDSPEEFAEFLNKALAAAK
ncbi:MAG: hypothetical protein ACYC3I_23895 [Gemmataceae bacterium]